MPISQFLTEVRTIVDPFITDPLHMPRRVMPATNIHTGANDSSSGSFWTSYMARAGDWKTSSNSTSFQTIVDLSGRGKFFGALSPTLSNTKTCTWRITVDGVVTTLPAILTNSGADRCILGDLLVLDTRYNTSGGVAGGTNGASARYSDFQYPRVQLDHAMKSLDDVKGFIQFATDLKVEYKLTGHNYATGYNYTGACWVFDE